MVATHSIWKAHLIKSSRPDSAPPLLSLPQNLLNTNPSATATDMTRGTWDPKKPVLKRFASEKASWRPAGTAAYTPNAWFDSTDINECFFGAGCCLRVVGTSKTEGVTPVCFGESSEGLTQAADPDPPQWEDKQKSLISETGRHALLFIALQNNGPTESRSLQA